MKKVALLLQVSCEIFAWFFIRMKKVMFGRIKSKFYVWLILFSLLCFWSIWFVKAETFEERLSQVGLDITTFSNKSSISRYEVARLLNAANCQDCIQAPDWMKQTYTQKFWDGFRAIDWKDFDDVNFEAGVWNKKSYYYCVAYVWDNGYMAWYPSTSTKCKWNFCGQEMITTSEFYQTVLNIIQDQIRSKYLIDWPKVKSWKKWLKKNSLQMKVLNQTNISAIDKADSKVWYAQTNEEFQAWLKYCMYNLSACNFQPFGIIWTWYWPVSELNILYKEWIISSQDAQNVATFPNMKWAEAIRIFSAVYDNFASCSFNVDYDCDGITNWDDNCPYVFNSNQYDLDGDWIWNVCDDDIDWDWKKNSIWIVDDNNHIVISLRDDSLDQTPLGNLDLWFSFFINVDAISTGFPTTVRFSPLTNWNISKVERDFGDGKKEIVNNWGKVTHIFNGTWFFNVKAVATSKNGSQSFATNKIFIAVPKTEKYYLNISPSILLKNWTVEYTFTPLYSGDLDKISWSINGWKEQSYKVVENFKATIKDAGMYIISAKWYKNWELKAVAMFSMLQNRSPLYANFTVKSADLWEKTFVTSNLVWILKNDVDHISINWWWEITDSTNLTQNYTYNEWWVKTIQQTLFLKDGTTLYNVATVSVQNPLLMQSYAVNVSWDHLSYNQNEKMSLGLYMYPRSSILSLFTSYQIWHNNYLSNPILSDTILDFGYSVAGDKLLTNLVEVNRCVALMNQWTVHINSLDVCETALKNGTLSKYKCDQDWDKIPDICDDDIDGDWVKNLIGIILKEKSDCTLWIDNVNLGLLKEELWVCSLDNCPFALNSNQSDLNNNWMGDFCESLMSDLLSGFSQNLEGNSIRIDRDQDGDWISDSMDNCIDVPWNSNDGCPRYYTQNCWVYSSCGNGVVDEGEDCQNCPQDVWICCWNWQLDFGETCVTCPQDAWVCKECGNGKVERWEDCKSCPQDVKECSAVCGDWKIQLAEDCDNCPVDVKLCRKNTCGDGNWDEEAGELCDNGKNNGKDKKCTLMCTIYDSKNPKCGNGVIDEWEDCTTCSVDLWELCVTMCGNGKYDKWETCTNCPQDLKERCVPMPVCWDDNVDEWENCRNCEKDLRRCIPTCGNGRYDGWETCTNCPQDLGECPNSCGNGEIELPEECDNWEKNGKDGICSEDCKALKQECGNGKKEGTEECDKWKDNGKNNWKKSCTKACTYFEQDKLECGNWVLDSWEDCGTCAIDYGNVCMWVCGDGVKNEVEVCDNWEKNWRDGRCTFECKIPDDSKKYCGNGIMEREIWEECDSWLMNGKDLKCGENCKNIVSKSECGNGKVEWEEECDYGKENNGKEWINCGINCKEKQKCGNMRKDIWEKCDNCPEDLWDKCKPEPVCGDENVDEWENCRNCEEDIKKCIPTCGNGKYDKWETCINCSQDLRECPNLCGNGKKEIPEECDNWTKNGKDGECTLMCTIYNPKNPECGNGKYDKWETCITCPEDLWDKCKPEPVCGDGNVDEWENCRNCEEDIKKCIPTCGNGKYDKWETCTNCPQDLGECPNSCGNGEVELPEECDNWEKNWKDGICLESCKALKQYCGNGKKEWKEVCDNGKNNGIYTWENSCTVSCTRFNPNNPECWNGKQDVWEDCWTCPEDLKRACMWVCGDGVLNMNEECDNWEKNWKDGACTFECKIPEDSKKYCGNKIVERELWEECDLWVRNGFSIECSSTCKKIPSNIECWNGILETWEECDYGKDLNGNEWINCGTNCKEKTKCENGKYDDGENCENCPQDLWKDCKPEPVCGDSYPDIEENCLDCPEDVWICNWFCGNGKVDTWEQCDPNDESKTNWWDYGCSTGCKINLVGDAECNNQYNWQTLLELKSDFNLCNKWEISSFSFENNVWTRLCLNDVVSVKCAAQKTDCWNWVMNEGEDCENCPDDCENPEVIEDWWKIENDDCNSCPCEYVDFSSDLTRWDTVRAKLWDKKLSVFYRYSNSVSLENFLKIGK